MHCILEVKSVTWYYLMIQHSRKAWFWSLLPLGYGSCHMLQDLVICSQLCVIFASKLGFTVFLSVSTEAQGGRMENTTE